MNHQPSLAATLLLLLRWKVSRTLLRARFYGGARSSPHHLGVVYLISSLSPVLVRGGDPLTGVRFHLLP